MTKKIFEERTIAAQVCDTLREEIISGAIPPNKRLTVKEICERYGVSTMPVREAFNILCGERILKNDAYKGATVLGLDVEYVRQIYEHQEALEVYMLKKSCEIGYTEQILSRLEAINASFASMPIDDYSNIARIELNLDFHKTLFSLCENTVVYDTYCKNYAFIAAARKFFTSSESRVSTSVDEHALLLEALRKNDVDLAVSITARHTSNAAQSCCNAVASGK